MATITSHTLNGLDGTHATGIAVSLRHLETGKLLFDTQVDAGGRLKQDVVSTEIDPKAMYELVFETGDYWHARGITGANVIPQVVLRFTIADPSGSYHMPVILNPHSYSTWLSG